MGVVLVAGKNADDVSVPLSGSQLDSEMSVVPERCISLIPFPAIIPLPKSQRRDVFIERGSIRDMPSPSRIRNICIGSQGISSSS
jgi:hypothetical protein